MQDVGIEGKTSDSFTVFCAFAAGCHTCRRGENRPVNRPRASGTSSSDLHQFLLFVMGNTAELGKIHLVANYQKRSGVYPGVPKWGTPMHRRSAKCVRCGITLIFSKRPETERRPEAVELFNCPACGSEFATTDNQIEGTALNAEFIEEFFSRFC
jgi:hypothetical protein